MFTLISYNSLLVIWSDRYGKVHYDYNYLPRHDITTFAL